TSFIEQHQEELIPPDPPSGAVLATAAKQFINAFASSPEIPGFRLNAPPKRTVRLLVGDQGDDVVAPAEWPLETYSSSAAPGVALVTDKGQTFALTLDHERGGPAGATTDGAVLAPMPGKVIAVDVTEGQAVTR